MRYTFEGYERLQWPFDSPNELGLALAFLAVVTIHGIYRSQGPLRFGLFLIFLLLSCGIVATYSRGSYLATTAGLICSAINCRRGSVNWQAVLIFIAAIVFYPGGIGRLKSMSSEMDRSSFNRIELWKGISAMAITERRLWGQGVRYFDEVYAPWYHQLETTVSYRGGVCNFFTIAAYFGAVTGITFCCLSMLGIVAAINVRGPWMSLSASLQCVFLCAGVFSTTLFWWWAYLVVVPAWVIGMYSIGALPRVYVAGVVSGTTLICASVLAILSALFWQSNGFRMTVADGAAGVRTLTPAYPISPIPVVVLISPNEQRFYARTIARALLNAGVIVTVRPMPDRPPVGQCTLVAIGDAADILFALIRRSPDYARHGCMVFLLEPRSRFLVVQHGVSVWHLDGTYTASSFETGETASRTMRREDVLSEIVATLRVRVRGLPSLTGCCGPEIPGCKPHIAKEWFNPS